MLTVCGAVLRPDSLMFSTISLRLADRNWQYDKVQIKHIQGQYGSYTVPRVQMLFAPRTQVSRVVISVFSRACLGRRSGFLYVLVLLYYAIYI